MEKIKTKCGYIAYKATAIEMATIGGLGICDYCNTPSSEGYIIPVLNRWYCPECYDRWNNEAEFFEEDLEYEERTAKLYESLIPPTDKEDIS